MIDPAAVFNRAVVALDQGDVDAAIADLEVVCRQAPGDAEALVLLVQAHRDHTEPDLAKAVALLAELTTGAAPGSRVAARVLLGELLLERGDPRGAARAVRPVLAANPDQWEALAVVGDAFSDVGAWEEAIAAYHHSLRSNPFTGRVWHNLAVALDRAGHAAQAEEAWATAARVERTT